MISLIRPTILMTPFLSIVARSLKKSYLPLLFLYRSYRIGSSYTLDLPCVIPFILIECFSCGDVIIIIAHENTATSNKKFTLFSDAGEFPCLRMNYLDLLMTDGSSYIINNILQLHSDVGLSDDSHFGYAILYLNIFHGRNCFAKLFYNFCWNHCSSYLNCLYGINIHRVHLHVLHYINQYCRYSYEMITLVFLYCCKSGLDIVSKIGQN